jgi:hypothetical protein
MDRRGIILILGLASFAFAQDTCQSWRNQYYQYCSQTPRLQQYQNSCNLYEQTCMNGGSRSGFESSSSTSSQTNNGGKPTWASLTQQAQNEQIQQAMTNAQNGQADCGQYKEHYNVWCGGKPVNPTYCSMMNQVCVTQAQQWASGQGGVNGNAFNSGNGMPTGGAGSTRPLTIGQNFGVGPFFGFGKQLGINPLQGVGTHTGVDVPIAGINVGGGKSVDYGGMLGVAQLGQLLQNGRRKRRWAIPVGVDQFGNRLYVLH